MTKADNNNWLDRKTFSNRTHFQRGLSRCEHRRESTMRDWYGSADAVGEIMAHQSKARSINDVIATVFSEMGMDKAVLLEELQSEWPRLVGVDVAKQARPVALHGGVLEIEVANATWRYILEREHRQQILQHVTDFSKGKIHHIRFVPCGRQRS